MPLYSITELPNAISQIHHVDLQKQETTVQENGIIVPDTGYDCFSKITVNVPSSELDMISNIIYDNRQFTDLMQLSISLPSQGSYCFQKYTGPSRYQNSSGRYHGATGLNYPINPSYKKIYFDVESKTDLYGSYPQSHIFLQTGSATPAGEQGGGSNVVKWITITGYGGTTPEQINNQEGVKIHSVDAHNLFRQVIEVDVPDISEDYYILFHKCDEILTIYSIIVVKEE